MLLFEQISKLVERERKAYHAIEGGRDRGIVGEGEVVFHGNRTNSTEESSRIKAERHAKVDEVGVGGL